MILKETVPTMNDSSKKLWCCRRPVAIEHDVTAFQLRDFLLKIKNMNDMSRHRNEDAQDEHHK